MSSRKGKGWRGGFVGSALEQYLKAKAHVEGVLSSARHYGDFTFRGVG